MMYFTQICVLLISFAGSALSAGDWYHGYEVIDGKCVSVTGFCNQPPFPYRTQDDCETNGEKVDGFNENSKRQEGYMLGDDKCLKVYGHCDTDPFDLPREKCEKNFEVQMRKRAVEVKIDGLKLAKFMVQFTIAVGALVFPPLGLLKPFVNLMWPTEKKKNVWDEVKDKVNSVIESQIDAANARDLADALTSMKTMMTTYNGLSDTNEKKHAMIVSIATLLESKEAKFMSTYSPVTTIAYYIPFACARIVVYQELIRMTSPTHKQEFYNAFLKMLMRYVAYMSNIVYGGVLEKWRGDRLSCTKKMFAVGRGRGWEYTFTDTLHSSNDVTQRNSLLKKDPHYYAWCKDKKRPIINIITKFLAEIKENIPAWATTFQVTANSPFVKGFIAKDSTFTTSGDFCSFPFTYSGVKYTSCTTVDNGGKYWCNTKSGSTYTWGNCAGVAKSKVDMTSCKTKANNAMQYFGHTHVDSKGRTCNLWTDQSSYNDLPMDGQNKTLAHNYCRRFLSSDYRPWCYTSGSWGYCDIPACAVKDWKP